MKSLRYYAVVAICVAGLCSPLGAQTHRSRNLSINFEGNGEHCSDLRVSSPGGEVAQANETFAFQRNEASVLEIDDAGQGAIRVRAWDQPGYSVEVCKVAVADDRGAAEQLVRGLTVTRSAGRFTTAVPANRDSGNWQLYFIVRAPKDANLDIQTKNGPIEVGDMTGTTKLRAVNGPISLKDCGGQVDARTTNGPISYSGSGGDVHLNATNGPISLKLNGEVWNGPKLDARTENGPISLSVSETYRSGLRLETDASAPVSCKAEFCRNAWTDSSASQRVLQLNGTDTVRVTTHNGPVSIKGPAPGKRVI
jgi:hypothetical protein